MIQLELKTNKVKKLQKRTESWDIRGWSLKQIKDHVNGIFRRKEIAIEELHITPQTLEVRYYENPNENVKLNPSKRVN
jgi:hypothetical protein